MIKTLINCLGRGHANIAVISVAANRSELIRQLLSQDSGEYGTLALSAGRNQLFDRVQRPVSRRIPTLESTESGPASMDGSRTPSVPLGAEPITRQRVHGSRSSATAKNITPLRHLQASEGVRCLLGTNCFRQECQLRVLQC